MQKDDPYNRHEERLQVFQFLRMKGVTPCIHDWPACGNRQDTKRNATAELAELMRGATGLTVLALKRALLPCAAACEPASKCKQCVNE